MFGVKSLKIVKNYMSGPVFLLCLISSLYGLITVIAHSPYGLQPNENISDCSSAFSYCICPREAVCATDIQDFILLLMSRLSIYFVYPYIMLLFLSKASYLVAMLQSKIYSVYFDFSNMHNIHKIGGVGVEVASWMHFICHLIRWARRSEMHFFLQNTSGLTGTIAISIMPLVTWPMSVSFIKKRLCYEYRKSLHYLSWVWGFAIIFHAPATKICWIIGFSVLIYFLNYLLVLHFGTFLVESTSFRRVGTGTLLSFENPKGFEVSGASYILVMSPWLGKNEWHAFSVFPHHHHQNTSSVFIANLGDWSTKLHKSIHRPTSRAVWISGPFRSPMSSAKDYDNIVSVASGIGITPALALLDRFKNTRRINLIWMCRDAHLIEFFVNTVNFPTKGFIFIFYTGKTLLNLRNNVPHNLFIFKDRPNLEYVISSTIKRIENGYGLPEEIVEEGNRFRSMSKEHRALALVGKVLEDYSSSEFFDTASCSMTNFQHHKTQNGLRSLIRGSISSTLTTFMQAADPQEKVITQESLNKAISEFLGDDTLSSEILSTMFDMMNGENTETISRDQFLLFVIENEIRDRDDDSDDSNLMSMSKSGHFLGSRNKGKTFPNFTTKKNVECPKLDPALMKTWILQYCGGSKSVLKTLHDIKKKYDIDLEIENYDF